LDEKVMQFTKPAHPFNRIRWHVFDSNLSLVSAKIWLDGTRRLYGLDQFVLVISLEIAR
jgi:hypothetical protein